MSIHKKRFILQQQVRFLDTNDINVLYDRCMSLSNIDKVAIILHDKDVRLWTDLEEEEKQPHFHFVLTFKNQISSLTVANTLKVPENQIRCVENWTTANLLYLIHYWKPDKFPYDPTEVKANFNYIEFVKKFVPIQDINDILIKIENWEIKPYERINHINSITYSKYHKRLEDAARWKLLKADFNNNNNRQMECVFISGPSGCWKTTLAKKIAQQDYNYSCYISSQWKNPFDNYMGEDCIILDDFRDDIMPFADFLKITDNNTSSLVGARYHNKSISNCKLLIITNVKPIKEIYSWETDDEIYRKQLYRRFKTLITITDEYIRWWNYDKAFNKYCEDFRTTNMFTNMYEDKWPAENLFLQNMRELYEDRIIKDFR